MSSVFPKALDNASAMETFIVQVTIQTVPVTEIFSPIFLSKLRISFQISMWNAF